MPILGNDGKPIRKVPESRTVEIRADQAAALERLANLEVTDPPGVLIGPKNASRRVQFFLHRFLRSQSSAIRAAAVLETLSPETREAVHNDLLMKGTNNESPTLAIAPTDEPPAARIPGRPTRGSEIPDDAAD